MATYAIQVPSKTAPGQTGQAIVGTPEWAEANLGGEWVEIPDPYNPDPDDPRNYAGPGMYYDPGVPEGFTGVVWDAEKATTMQPDGDGGFFWTHNTKGELVWHEPTQKIWRNLMDDGTPNTWEPGVANWREYPLDNGVPVWLPPTGTEDAYPNGFVVKHNGGRYESNIPANTTTPGTDERWWITLDAPPAPAVAPWEQRGSTDAYMTGDPVLWTDGDVYESTIDNNTWSPSSYPAGWRKVV